MWTRRQFVSRGVLGMLGLGGAYLALPAGGLGAGDRNADPEALPDGSASKDMMEKSDPAIARGLSYLASHRNHDNSFGTRAYVGNVAVTSLAGLAFMAGGNQPNRGPYGGVVLDTLRFVLSQENRNRRADQAGFLFNPDNALGNFDMYSHGFGTLFLAEVSGMVQDPALSDEVNKKLHLAVKLILQCQNAAGGWRYKPEPNDADVSVTICQIMALRAARNAGVAVPKSTRDRCVKYVMERQDRTTGQFHYSDKGDPDNDFFARTAAGVVALNSAGYYLNTDPTQFADIVEQSRAVDAVDRLKRGMEFLRRNRPVGGPNGRTAFHYFYGHYYATQAMWVAGGDYWKEWYPYIRDELVSLQTGDGSWFDNLCYHYATAMACIILQVPNNYLPILQR